MKSISILTVFLLLFLGLNISYAQQSVTINQKGTGNSVTINQSVKNDGDCSKMFNKLSSNSNIILIRRAHRTPDTLANVSGEQRNVVKKQLGKQQLAASQVGTGNGLYIALPDSQTSYKKFKSTQNGSRNRISTYINNAVHQVAVSQKGSGNTIAVNPCEEQKRTTQYQKDSTKIIQTR